MSFSYRRVTSTLRQYTIGFVVGNVIIMRGTYFFRRPTTNEILFYITTNRPTTIYVLGPMICYYFWDFNYGAVIPPILPSTMTYFPSTIYTILLQPRHFLYQIARRDVRSTSTTGRLPKDLFRGNPLMMIQIQMGNNPYHRRACNLRHIFI